MPPGSCDKNKSARHTHQRAHTHTQACRQSSRFNIEGCHTHTHTDNGRTVYSTHTHTHALPRTTTTPTARSCPGRHTHTHRHAHMNRGASLNIIHTIKPRAAAFARLDINFYRQHPFLAACVRARKGEKGKKGAEVLDCCQRNPPPPLGNMLSELFGQGPSEQVESQRGCVISALLVLAF